MTLYISVVICTYNRADLLAVALESVCTQTIDEAAYEVIVVDNNSTDDTPTVTDSFCQRYPNVRYIFEPQPGNSHARNVGWQKADAQYIAFMDDDCKVPPDWLTNAFDIIKKISPDVFGGPYYAFYNTPKPRWFKDTYGSYTLCDQATILERPEGLAAGNLFIKTDVLKKTSGFNPAFGIIDQKRGYGEETELLQRIRDTNPELVAYYDPDMFVYHLVRPEKMTWRWLIRDRFTKGRYIHQVFQAQTKGKTGRIFILAQGGWVSLRLLVDIILLASFRNRKKQPYLQQYFYESSLEYVKRLGQIYEHFRHR